MSRLVWNLKQSDNVVLRTPQGDEIVVTMQDYKGMAAVLTFDAPKHIHITVNTEKKRETGVQV
jgi:sRNA-binding carbon storage regulator CsrA